MTNRVFSLAMSGTFYSTAGLQRFSGAPVRSAAFALIAAGILGMLAISFIGFRTWRELGRVQGELRGPAAERLIAARNIQHDLERMNAALLRFKLSNSLEDHEVFETLASAVQSSLAGSTAEPRLRPLFAAYLEQASAFISEPLGAVRKDSAARVHEAIQRISSALMQAVATSAKDQSVSLNAALTSSATAIATARRLIVTAGLLLALLIAGGILLAYAPIRRQTRETHAMQQRQEKLASLGTLATGIAHEIRNPLAAIKFRLFSLKKALPPAISSNEDLGVIKHEIDRLEHMVQDFLHFARPAEPKAELVSARELLLGVQTLLAPQLEKNAIRLQTEAAEGLELCADKQQLEQVLINLVQNASDSIGRDGEITLRARQGVSKVNRQSTALLMLEVADTGRGISPEVEGRIFDPFFSTKDSGTGLGLSIAARIVENHGGFIQYQSQVNRGTTFTIVLPRPQNHVAAHPAH